MEPIREDFHEAELFYELSEAAGGSDSESAEDACLSLADEGKERQDEPDANSGKSSLTFTALDTGAELPHQAALGSGYQLGGFHPLPMSMPVASAHIRMGSSVPVSIPHMNRWKKSDDASDSPTAQYAPATFVPPHQLSQVNECMFSFTGESPSVAIKRERLRVRNAILKSTGFLEPGVEQINNIGLQERNRLTVAAGGLSQALQQQGATVGSIAAAAKSSSS